MTIRKIANFYFNNYPKININVEMWGGLRGRYTLYTKKSFEVELNGWLDEEVIIMHFDTHAHNYADGTISKRDYPVLYICYK